MKLVISNDVMLTVKEYEESLKDYPISNSRRKTKVTKLMRALKGIRKIPMSFPICKYKDLGQHFDSSGKPLFAFLRQFNYEDESKFQWSFAFVIDTANKTITITKMSPSIFIKENKQNKTYKTMNRIRLTESQLHNVIRRCVNEAIMDTPYGKVNNEPYSPTFDDDETQSSLKNDMIDMLSKLPTEKFLKYYNRRMSYNDPDIVDAIYREYYLRSQRGEI